MANVNNSCMPCEKLGFCHHRQTSPPSGFLSDGATYSLTVVTITYKWSLTEARI